MATPPTVPPMMAPQLTLLEVEGGVWPFGEGATVKFGGEAWEEELSIVVCVALVLVLPLLLALRVGRGKNERERVIDGGRIVLDVY